MIPLVKLAALFLTFTFAAPTFAAPVESSGTITTALSPRQCKDKAAGGSQSGQEGAGGRGGGQGRGHWRNHNKGVDPSGSAAPAPAPAPEPQPTVLLADTGDDDNADAQGGGKTQTRTATLTKTLTTEDAAPSTSEREEVSPKPAPQPTRDPQPSPQPQPNPEPQPDPAPAPDVDDSDTTGKVSSTDPKALLQLHNDYRASHGAGALTWSEEMQSYATKYSLNCPKGHSGGKYGENIAAGTGAADPAGLFGIWTNEEGDYDPNNPKYSHYTQVVWKGAKQLGCSLVTCPGGTLFGQESMLLICEYDTGNVIGQFKDNVG